MLVLLLALSAAAVEPKVIATFSDPAAQRERLVAEQISRPSTIPSEAFAGQLVEAELANLTQNLLAGLASPTLTSMISDRESEKAHLEAQRRATATSRQAEILPHPVLLERFAGKVAALRASLDDDAVRTGAAAVLARLIESVTIYPDGPRGAEAEIVAKVEDLMAFAKNENAVPKGGVSSSTTFVAGADLTAAELASSSTMAWLCPANDRCWAGSGLAASRIEAPRGCRSSAPTVNGS